MSAPRVVTLGILVGAAASVAVLAVAVVAIGGPARARAEDAGTVARLGAEVVARAGEVDGFAREPDGGPERVAVGVHVRTEGAAGARALEGALGAAIARALGVRTPRALVDVRTPNEIADDSDGFARAAVRRGERVAIHVSVTLRGRAVVAEVSTYVSRQGGGMAALMTARTPARVASTLELPLDAELAGYLGAPRPLRRETVRAARVALPGRGYLALTSADLDGDGARELVLLGEDRVEALRVRRTRRGALEATPIATAALDALGRPPAHPRRAIGALAARERAVVGRASAYAVPFIVRLEGAALDVATAPDVCPENGYPLSDPSVCARAVLGRDYFHGDLAPVEVASDASNTSDAPATSDASRPSDARRTPAPSRGPSPPGFYARAARTIAQRDGPPLPIDARITPRGRLVLVTGDRRRVVQDVGAAVAVADLDADGRPDILTSSPRALGEGDQLTLRTLGRTLATVYESPALSGSVLVAASTDLDGDGAEELVAIEEPAPSTPAATTATLWMIQ